VRIVVRDMGGGRPAVQATSVIVAEAQDIRCIEPVLVEA
jgi:hypothetical protein